MPSNVLPCQSVGKEESVEGASKMLCEYNKYSEATYKISANVLRNVNDIFAGVSLSQNKRHRANILTKVQVTSTNNP